MMRLDDRVLPGGDAERMEVPLSQSEGILEVRTGVSSGSNRPTRPIAPSWSVPVGVPFGSRSIRPSLGSGVSAVTPARSSARELAHAL